MSLQPTTEFAIPADTAQAVHSALPKGNIYLRMRDELGVVYQDSDFADLFSRRGQPAEAPWRLMLVTIMQFAEGLTDRQAAEAVATRLDWKYVLGLAVGAPGFDYSVLSEFRQRLLAGGAEERLLERLLTRLGDLGLLRPRGRQRTDSTHVLAHVRRLNRLELVGETLRQALEALADAAPEWLLAQITPAWFERYCDRFEQFRLPKEPTAQHALAVTIGQDGHHLLAALAAAPSTLHHLRQLAAVELLRQVWLQNYYHDDGCVCWRAADNLPPAERLIQSPYDAAARFSHKRTTEWVGYKTHLTETCDEDLPHLIVNVETTPATRPDVALTETIHEHLAARQLLPAEHLVDAGYVDADNLVQAQQKFGVTLVGPAPADTSWQAQHQPDFALERFALDWATQTVTCPQGQRSQVWATSQDSFGNPVVQVRFAAVDCAACPVRQQCTRAATGPRSLKLRPQAQHEALQQARARQLTLTFKTTYAKRAGIEGTLSQAVNALELRQARYRGLAKTHLQNIITAVVINIARFAAWQAGKRRATTRTSRFAALRSLLLPGRLALSSAPAT